MPEMEIGRVVKVNVTEEPEVPVPLVVYEPDTSPIIVSFELFEANNFPVKVPPFPLLLEVYEGQI